MRYMLIAASLALPLAVQPVQAEEQDATTAQQTHPLETLHAPTNRVGEAVPTMTAPASETDEAAAETSGEHKAETVHPPTNRVGKAVPTMKSAQNKDDQKTSKTYYHEDAAGSSDN